MPPLTSRCSCQPAHAGQESSLQVSIESLLAKLPLFSSLSEGEIAILAKPARKIHAEKGKIIFHKGDSCHGFYLIVSGKVKLVINSAFGNEKVVEILMPGQTFGEAVMFVDEPYPLSAQVLADALFVYVTKQSVLQALESTPSLARKLITSLSVSLQQLVQNQEFNSLRSGKQRVLDYLLRQITPEDAGNPHPTIILPASKGTIASHLGITAEHFSRVLHELIESELLKVRGKRIEIANVRQVRELLDGSEPAREQLANCQLITLPHWKKPQGSDSSPRFQPSTACDTSALAPPTRC